MSDIPHSANKIGCKSFHVLRADQIDELAEILLEKISYPEGWQWYAGQIRTSHDCCDTGITGKNDELNLSVEYLFGAALFYFDYSGKKFSCGFNPTTCIFIREHNSLRILKQKLLAIYKKVERLQDEEIFKEERQKADKLIKSLRGGKRCAS
ncbi:MAG: hypothetical protein U9P90_01250 [Patescibacteria group bacterium]|nr:hypothetical protein [Patescibacteria group bacterium]